MQYLCQRVGGTIHARSILLVPLLIVLLVCSGLASQTDAHIRQAHAQTQELRLGSTGLRIELQQGFSRKNIEVGMLVRAVNVTQLKLFAHVIQNPADESGNPLKGGVMIQERNPLNVGMQDGIGVTSIHLTVSTDADAPLGTYRGVIIIVAPFQTQEITITVVVKSSTPIGYFAIWLGVFVSYLWSALRFQTPSGVGQAGSQQNPLGSKREWVRRLRAWKRWKGFATYFPYFAASFVISALVLPTFFERFPDFGKDLWRDGFLAFSFGFFWQSLVEKTRSRPNASSGVV